MMSPSELFNDILSNLDPYEVPSEYVLFARVTDVHGREKTLQGDELTAALKDRRTITEIQIVINVPKIRDVIARRVNEIYDGINALCMQDGFDEDFDEITELRGLDEDQLKGLLGPSKNTDN